MKPEVFDAAAMASVDVDLPEFVSTIAAGMRAYASGELVVCPKAALHPEFGGLFHAMPATDADLSILKWVSIGSEAGGAIESLMIATDARSGRTIAILDANRITDLRTAAVSLLAIEYLAPKRHGAALGIAGCGRQARAHIEMIADCAPWITDLHVFCIRNGSAAALAADAKDKFRTIRVCTSAEDLVRHSDILDSNFKCNG